MKTLGAEFVISAASSRDFPAEDAPEIAIAGRSNVGKSSLINAIVGADGLAKTSSTPGRTRLINWFAVTAPQGQRYALVDLPGFGYARVPKEMQASWQPLVEACLKRKTLRAVILLVDIRRGLEQEEQDLAEWLASEGVAARLVVTKADKVSKAERIPAVQRMGWVGSRPILCSAKTGEGIVDIQKMIARVLGSVRE